MLSVYGVAPSERLFQGKPEAEFPPFHGHPLGGAVLVDCAVSLMKLSNQALVDWQYWPWKPALQGYALALENQPVSALKNHLRGLRYLLDETGQSRLWPWFDPRYMQLALRSLEGDDLARLFGPVQQFAFASDTGIELFSQHEGCLKVKAAGPC
jgi:hypothetical protein